MLGIANSEEISRHHFPESFDHRMFYFSLGASGGTCVWWNILWYGFGSRRRNTLALEQKEHGFEFQLHYFLGQLLNPISLMVLIYKLKA